MYVEGRPDADPTEIAAIVKRPKMRFTSNVVATLAVATDLFCLAISLPLARMLTSLLFTPYFDRALHVTGAAIISVNFLLIRLSRNAYSNPLGRARNADQGVVIDFAIASTLVVATIWQLGMLGEFSRGVTLCYVGVGSSVLLISRFALRKLVWYLVSAGYIGQRIIIYGADEGVTERALRLLELERLPYLSIVGVADNRNTRLPESVRVGAPFIGDLGAVVRMAKEDEVDQVLIALPGISQDRLEDLLSTLGEVAVDIGLIPRETIDLTTQYDVRYIGTLPIFALWQRPIRDFDTVAKKLEDVTLALAGVIVLAPLLIATALVVRITSKGPILFRQRRFGFNNIEIDVLKFRSMYVDRQDLSGAERTTRRDPRITPVGRIIRRLSIDELPQLFNVLRGEMSIVGPRPHATYMKVGDLYYFDAVKGYAARHRVKPGITGLAQISGLRGEIDTIERAKQRVDYDRYYIDNWTLMLDIRIIFGTLYCLVWDKNAY